MAKCPHCGITNDDEAQTCEGCGGKLRPETTDPKPKADLPPGHMRCISCGASIRLDSILCPKCGWAQPRLA